MPDFSVGLDPELAAILAPVINCAILAAVGYKAMKSTTTVAWDMVEEADANTNFKLFMTSLLTQAGVVSALLLSIEIPMFQIQPPGGAQQGTLLWDAYYGTCFLSAGFSVQGVCSSVLSLAYIQGLNNSQAFAFMVANPDAIGFAIGSMAAAAYLLILQTMLYYIITAPSYYMIIYIVVAGAVCLGNITSGWRGMSLFKNGEVSSAQRDARRAILGGGAPNTFRSWASSVVCCRVVGRTQDVGPGSGFLLRDNLA